jgi:hypothetical protein
VIGNLPRNLFPVDTWTVAPLAARGDPFKGRVNAKLAYWVKTDKIHCENNESGYPSVADMRADIN